MNWRQTDIEGVLIGSRPRFHDERGWFEEALSPRLCGHDQGTWRQLNISLSHQNVVRGLHLQARYPQAKWVWPVVGDIWDVVVDTRPDSPSFGRWFATKLSASQSHVIFIPKGCAHGFAALSEPAIVQYAVDAPYRPDDELVLRFDDPFFSIPWPVSTPVISEKDRNGVLWAQLDFSKGYPRVTE